MICEDPVRIAFYRDLKESLQVSDQGPFGCGCQSCEELNSTIFWGSKPITRACGDAMRVTFWNVVHNKSCSTSCEQHFPLLRQMT